MVSNYLNFDFQDTKDAIGGVISSALRTLDRPRGAAIAALKLQNPLEGFKNPNEYQGRDVLGIQNIQNERLRNVVGAAVDVAADPLNLLAAAPVRALSKVGVISKLVLPVNESAGALSRVAANYAMGAGARVSSELATAGLDKTNLPGYIKTPLVVGAGLAGAVTASRPFGVNVAGKSRMVESQFKKQYTVVRAGDNGIERKDTYDNLAEAKADLKVYQLDAPDEAARYSIEESIVDPSGSDYFTYIDTVTANDGLHVKDKQGKILYIGSTIQDAYSWALNNIDNGQPKGWVSARYNNQVLDSNIYSTREEALSAALMKDPLNGRALLVGPKVGIDYSLVSVNGLKNMIAANTFPEMNIPIGKDAELIDRNVMVIPADRAPIDELLDAQHEINTRGFGENQFTQPRAYKAKSNWIQHTGDPNDPESAGYVIRQALLGDSEKDFDEIAMALYSEGEITARIPLSNLDTPFSHGNKTFLYRGENSTVKSVVDENDNELGRFKTYEEADVFRVQHELDNNKVGQYSIQDEYPPLNEKDLVASSYTSDPNTAQSFTNGKQIYNPDTGQKEQVRFIHGRWVDNDSIMGAFGRGSKEHEYIVLDKTQISDARWKKLTGVDKNAPLGTKVYQVFNPVDGVIVKYVDTEAEAIEATKNVIKSNTPYYYQVVETGIGGERKHGVFTSKVDASISINILESDKPGSVGFYDIKTVGGPVDTNLDYQQVSRGYDPQVNITKQSNIINKDEVITNARGEDLFNVYKKDGTIAMHLQIEEIASKFARANDYTYEYARQPSNKFAGMFGPGQRVGINGSDLPSGGNKLPKAFEGKPMIPVSRNALPDNDIVANITKGITGEAGGAGDIIPPIKPPTDSRPLSDLPEDKIPPQTPQQIASDVGYDYSIVAGPETLDIFNKARADVLVLKLMGNRVPPQAVHDELINLFLNHLDDKARVDPTVLGRANSIFRGLWATADASWMGIQGLMTIPRMIATGNLADAGGAFYASMATLVGSKKAFGEFLIHQLETLPADAPSLTVLAHNGLKVNFLERVGDFDMRLLDRVTGGHLQPDAAFNAYGDAMRISTFYNEWARYGKPTGEELKGLINAVNRSTGVAEHAFGGQIGTFAMFAPRFFQSQLESVAHALTDGSIEGSLARRQFLTMIGTGASLTVASNYLRGYTDTDQFNPTSPNFMRIRNIGGQDISVFGPWDSLVKLTMHLGTGDFAYAQTKASPLVTIGINTLRGTTYLGEDFNNPAVVAKSLLLPFGFQNFGRETWTGFGIGLLGVKSSPQSAKEVREANMANLGLDPTDPLAIREYLAENPEQKVLYSKSQKEVNEVQQDIRSRAELNNEKTVTNNQTLVQFRSNRTILQREQRNKLEVLLKDNNFKADTTKRQWIQSYYSLFDAAKDPITHDVNPSQLDELQSNWISTNGQQAYDYLQSYLLVNKTPTDLIYLNDMKKLHDLNYFNTPKYRPNIYSSGLDDHQIQSYRDMVSAARSANSTLASLPFNAAARLVLGKVISGSQINSITMAGQDIYANPTISSIKKNNPELFVWFNPNATWTTRETLLTNKNKRPVGVSVGIPTISQVANQQQPQGVTIASR